jgi:hypothetical protein
MRLSAVYLHNICVVCAVCTVAVVWFILGGKAGVDCHSSSHRAHQFHHTCTKTCQNSRPKSTAKGNVWDLNRPSPKLYLQKLHHLTLYTSYTGIHHVSYRLLPHLRRRRPRVPPLKPAALVAKRGKALPRRHRLVGARAPWGPALAPGGGILLVAAEALGVWRDACGVLVMGARGRVGACCVKLRCAAGDEDLRAEDMISRSTHRARGRWRPPRTTAR